MKAVTFRGPYRGISGYDLVVRSLAREFLGRGVRLQMIDLPRWSPGKLPWAVRDPVFRGLWQLVPSKTVVHFCMPHQADPFAGMANANFTMFEGSKVPEFWIEAHRRHELVIVPTRHCMEMWVAAGLPKDKIATCPLGVDCGTYRPGVEPLTLHDEEGRPVSSYRVRFLNVSDVVPRKNLEGLYRCWLTATNGGDDAILIMKTSCGSSKWLARFMQHLRDVERDVGRRPEEAAPILWLLNRRLPDADMPRLFASATHYWSMSRGEGWDLGMAQAGATALELLAARHTGYLTYLDDTVAHMMPVRETAASSVWSDNLDRLFQGATWWEPDADAAIDLLRRAIDGRLESKGTDARERIASRFTWSHAADRLLKILEPIDAAASGVRRPTGRLLLAALRPI
jgi:glycosyltransferase involved in cell wall biosynthesis